MKKKAYLLLMRVANSFSGYNLGKIPGVAPLYYGIRKAMKPKDTILVTYKGIKMYVNANDDNMAPFFLMGRDYEKEEIDLLKNLVKPGMTVVDIGANMGYFTLVAAKAMENKGKIYAFEPAPDNYEIIKKNIEINKHTNIIPVSKAVSDKCGKTKFFVENTSSGTHSFSKENVSRRAKFIEVETTTLDDFFGAAKGNKIDLIKMDTQGAEGLIINGAKKILADNNHVKIIMEFWPYGLKNVGTDPAKLLQKLQGYGFKIKVVDGGIKHNKITEIIKLCEDSEAGRGFINLLLEK